jgi:hypothetical protein
MKRVLVDAGFEVFRTRGDEIVLAERPRENLILDSGVALRIGSPFQVRLTLRAQKADYPNEDEAHLFERVRSLAAPALAEGFVEVKATVAPVMDPGDPARTLDTFFEILYSKDVTVLEDALTGLRFAISLEKRS